MEISRRGFFSAVAGGGASLVSTGVVSSGEPTRKLNVAFDCAYASEVIDMALDDLEVVEREPYNFVNMDWCWHSGAGPSNFRIVQDDPEAARRDTFLLKDRCCVDLPGAVMAQRLGVRDDTFADIDGFVDPIRNRLQALGQFQYGQVSSGLAFLIAEDQARPYRSVDITDYADNPGQFKSDLRAIAAGLRADGL